MKTLFTILLAAALASSALAKKKVEQPTESPIDKYIEDAERRATAAGQGSSGSIWTPEARFSGLAVDLRASRVDDIVTVVVSESASAVSSGATQSQRASSVKAGVPALLGIPKAAGALPNLASASSDVKLDGQGTTTRSANLTTSLSARVTHVLPNGNLVIEGVKNLVVNSEAQQVTVRGVVRPIDLDTGNTVASARLAQLEVRINGKGVVGDAIRRPNILYRILLGVLPF